MFSWQRAVQGKANDQLYWRVLQKEKLASLKEKLCRNNELLADVRQNPSRAIGDVLSKSNLHSESLGHMAITSELLHKQSVIIKQAKRIGMSFLDLATTKDPIRYVVQLLNLVVRNLAAPALHNSGFPGSCSRIWQRDSYWNAYPFSESEYPLFIPRQNYCSTSVKNSWTDRSSSNFGVASMESEKRLLLDSSRSSSFNYSSVSPHSVETHKDLQKGISLLKKSVACVTAYGYNMLCLDVFVF